ncbi:putative forkhead box protein N3-like [Scophthalmus maximus]|uniref:Forkhead box protein N3 n=1 Tax=Scophthalmus maximus TaxID=52904 RepID=A0A2U9CSX9_SCOMX|nr:putative forkhead box protein N3-like [Scophthalmus maximus]
MGPTMPPSKKAQSPSSGASASQGMSPPYRQGDAATAASEAEAADLSLSLSASFSKAEDEELTSLSWLHESTDLLNSFSHSGLRSVSPLQDPDGQHPRSPSSSSPSPDDALLGDGHSVYDLAAGANRKPPYSFSCLIFMAIEDAPNKRLPVKDIYGWILEHFPYFANAPTGWKNSVRHNLSLNKCFKKVDKDRSQSIGKGSLWSIDPEYRHNLIQALKKTPYHPYSPGLATPSTSPPTLPQTFHHSPPLWSGSPLFRKNGGVLLQGTVSHLSVPSPLTSSTVYGFPRGVIQNGARVRSQALFPVIRPLPVSPVGSRTSAIRSSLGDYLSRGQDSPSCYSPPPCGEDLQDDHTYSTAKSPSRLCSSQVAASSCPLDDDDIIAVEIQSDVKTEPREIPLDSHLAAAAYISQQPLRGQRRSSGSGAGTLAGSSLPWTKSRARGISDTLPLKKRRAAAVEKPPESDDEEMKEAAGSLLHLAGVRACLNNITNRTAKGQKEQKEALRN